MVLQSPQAAASGHLERGSEATCLGPLLGQALLSGQQDVLPPPRCVRCFHRPIRRRTWLHTVISTCIFKNKTRATWQPPPPLPDALLLCTTTASAIPPRRPATREEGAGSGGGVPEARLWSRCRLAAGKWPAPREGVLRSQSLVRGWGWAETHQFPNPDSTLAWGLGTVGLSARDRLDWTPSVGPLERARWNEALGPGLGSLGASSRASQGGQGQGKA